MKLNPSVNIGPENLAKVGRDQHHNPVLPAVRGPGRPSPSRLRRPGDHRPDQIRAAVLHVPQESGAIRTLVGGAHRHLIGVFPSKKTGLPNPFEGRLERALIHWCEVDGRVVDYQSQAARLVFPTDAGRREWIIDLLRQMEDGTVEAIEVKRSERDLRDPDYALKLSYARAIVESFGWRFRIMMAEQIYGPLARIRNVARIQMRRSVHIDHDAQARFERLATSHPIALFQQVREVLDDRIVQGVALAQRMIAAGRVLVDLDRDIRDNTVVQLRPPRLVQSRIRF